MVSLDSNIDLNSLLGQSISIQVKQLYASDHWLNGDIISIKLKGQEEGSSRYYIYQADVYPRLWYLSQNKDFRIFQE